MEAGEKAPAVWPGRDKRRRRQTKPVPSRRSPATTRGSSDCHPGEDQAGSQRARQDVVRTHCGHAASCPRLCPREGVCTGCRCLPPALQCAADVGLWLTPGQALKALGAGKRSALPPRCPQTKPHWARTPSSSHCSEQQGRAEPVPTLPPRGSAQGQRKSSSW